MGEDDVVTTPLSPAQQQLAADALRYCPAAVGSFIRKNPSYRRLLRHCDLESVAQLAVVQASRTYQPSLSQPQTYFGAAIRHALLKEVRRARRSREGAHERISMPKALALSPAGLTGQTALACLETLPEYSRSVVQRHVLGSISMAQIAREDGVQWQTVRARLSQAYEQLRACADANGETTEGSPDREPDTQA